ncbi:phosphoglycerate kinase [Candidatus Saccharibacteria bacterium]|nr:phosphoglycerate kinase [Candidatus Saccharibacteria bacterium]
MPKASEFHKKTLKDIDLEGKTVLVRTDYNVPVDESGKITDDYRIKQSLPTVQYLISKNCKIVLCSHLGRPDGKRDLKFTLRPCAESLSSLIGEQVDFIDDCIGDKVAEKVASLKQGQICLLENLRFYPEEESNDTEFAKELAGSAQVFVQDGFGVVHRAHASTDAITNILPSVAGFLLEKEVSTITSVMNNPNRPLMSVIGGAKISDKIDVLNRLIDISDIVAVGGAMANTFLHAKGVNTGKSLIEKSEIGVAKQIMKRAKDKSAIQKFVLYIPQDAVVATGLDKSAKTRIVDWDAHVVADIENYPKRVPRSESVVADDEMILDIGPFSGAFIAGAIQLSGTVIWNGALGVTEVKGLQGPIGPFAHGTQLLVDALLGDFGNKPYSLLGGGDTVGYIRDLGLTDMFNHVSTGGGASIELMSGLALPGVESLLNKDD